MGEKVVTFPGVRVVTEANAHIFQGDAPETRSKCRYCREGHKPNAKGEHWIVKGVFPARIDIQKCKDAQTP